MTEMNLYSKEKDELSPVTSCDCERTILQEAEEIEDRIKYFYDDLTHQKGIIFDTPSECQVIPLVIDLINKIKKEY